MTQKQKYVCTMRDSRERGSGKRMQVEKNKLLLNTYILYITITKTKTKLKTKIQLR